MENTVNIWKEDWVNLLATTCLMSGVAESFLAESVGMKSVEKPQQASTYAAECALMHFDNQLTHLCIYVLTGRFTLYDEQK